MLAVAIAVLSVTSVYGGPARSLASVMNSARTAKIPRAIRAPFRNSEMMTARGFGKRSQMIKFKDGNSSFFPFKFYCIVFFFFDEKDIVRKRENDKNKMNFNYE